MQSLRDLVALARLAGAPREPGETASEAARVLRRLIGSDDVRLLSGDGVNFRCFPPSDDGGFYGLTPRGRVEGHAELMKLGRPAVCSIGADGLFHDIAPADGSHGGTHLAVALSLEDTSTEDVVARGPWSAAAAATAAVRLEAAMPALAIIFGRVVDGGRTERVQQQLDALSNVARVFTRARTMPQVLQDLVRTVNSATGMLATLDVFDSRGRITLRSTATAHLEGTPLVDLWRGMARVPDPVREMILREKRPVLLPNLQDDPRISEAARRFYRGAGVVSGASFPLVFQDEVVGLMRMGSLKPSDFPPHQVALLQALADQAAVVVKGVQLWDELEQSRKQTERYAARLQASMEIQHHLARTDALCGIPNRRYLDEVVVAECARAARYGSHLSLAMADLDHFKAVNDRYGHDVGDVVLRQVAMTARANCRKVDVVGRLGGDEFLFVLPSTPLRRAVTWADRFRRVLEGTPVGPSGGEAFHTTISLGVAQADLECLGDPRLLMRRCDDALYSAKSGGRNQVRYHQPRLAEAVV